MVLGRAGAGGVVDKDGDEGPFVRGSLRVGDRAGATRPPYDPVARMELLDEIGIWAQIVFPGVVGLGGQSLGDVVQDVALRTLCLEIFNDASAEIQAESGNRLLPMAILPAWDIDACVREVQRAKASGCAASTSRPTRRTSARPTSRAARGTRCGTRAARCELPVHFHIGASLTTMNYFGTYPWESHDDDTKLAIGGTLLFIGNARVVVNIICSGMLDRYPELKIVSVESGTGWIPFILEALDYEMDENAPQAEGARCR